MVSSISINGRKIGSGHPVFIIAEIGVNHNGDLALAREMISKAAQCGADCVKFQTFKAEDIVTSDAPKANYQLKTTPSDESQLAMLKKLETPYTAYDEIISCCNQHGVAFMSTPYNPEDVDMLDDLGVPVFKLASIHAAEPLFAKYAAKKGKPIIMSTGMATLAEVDESVRAMREVGNNDLVLLQCTTNYPSRHKDANLLSMKTMESAFNILVGYSDHTIDDIACIVSVGLGAKIIEKHFTLNKSLPGPDQSTSANPDEFQRLVQNIRKAEQIMGSGIKTPCDIEKKNAVGMRRSIVAKNDITKGDILEPKMFTFKRPATGVPPKYLEQLSGKRAQKNIIAGSLVLWSHIGD
ncbi:MAG: N-acetylneuraminate synthase [Desulfobacteraceae bacterium]|nr:N-acetylneuraminate synthase [Desulfobacteraceae bacterium]